MNLSVFEKNNYLLNASINGGMFLVLFAGGIVRIEGVTGLSNLSVKTCLALVVLSCVSLVGEILGLMLSAFVATVTIFPLYIQPIFFAIVGWVTVGFAEMVLPKMFNYIEAGNYVDWFIYFALGLQFQVINNKLSIKWLK